MIYKESYRKIEIEFEDEDTEHLKKSMANAIYGCFKQNKMVDKIIKNSAYGKKNEM